MSKNINLSGGVFSTICILALLAGATLFYAGHNLQQSHKNEAAYIKQLYITAQKESVRSKVETEISVIEYESKSDEEGNWKYLSAALKRSINLSKQLLLSSQSESAEIMYAELGKKFPLSEIPGNVQIRIMSVDGGIILNEEYKTTNDTELKNITDAYGSTIILNEIEKMRDQQFTRLMSYWKSGRTLRKKYTLTGKIPGSRLYIALSTLQEEQGETVKDRAIKRISSVEDNRVLSAFTVDGIMEASSDTALINKNISEMRDAEGEYVYQKMLKTASRKEGGYIIYSSEKAGGGKEKRIAYVASFDEWKWCIVSSISMESYSEDVQSKLAALDSRFRTKLMFTVFCILLVYGAAFWFVIGRNRRGVNELVMLENNFRAAAEENVKAEANRFILNELYQTTLYGNMMVDTILQQRMELEKYSQHDELTGFYNENSFKEIVDYEIKLFNEFRSPLSLVALSINSFDEMLSTEELMSSDSRVCQCAKIIEKQCRTIDTLMRMKDATFIILLPRMSRFQANQVLVKIRDRLARSEIKEDQKCTLSGGVTGIRINDTTETFFERVLSALEEAGAEGGGKIIVS